MMVRWTTLLLALALMSPVGKVHAAALALPPALVARLDALGGDSLQVQLEVVDLAEGTGTPVYSRQAEMRQTPASVVKLCTAALALELWGPEHRFKTRLGYNPAEVIRVGDSRLARNLVIQASGDPTLVKSDLVRLMQRVWQSGVDGLAGPVMIQANGFDERRLGPGWMWDDAGSPYAARPTQLTIQGNSLFALAGPRGWELPGAALMNVTQEPGARGVGARLLRSWRDGSDAFTFIAPLLSSGNSLPRRTWRIQPLEPACNVEFPDSLFRSCVLEAAEEVFGSSPLPVLGKSRRWATKGMVWQEHLGPPLAVVLDSVLTESWNLGAECLFQAMAAADPKPGVENWDRAAELSKAVLRDSLGLKGWFRQVDGSGLSRYNAISPRQVTQLLAAMELRHPAILARLLPGSGEGTLRGDGPKLPPGIQLSAKTGTLRGVLALAGYLEQNGRPRLAFCLMITGQQTREIAVGIRNEIVESLARFMQTAAPPGK